MAPRKPSDTSTATKEPLTTTPKVSPVTNTSNSSAVSLPTSLDVQLPDFRSQIPTDFFKPSSSSVPRTNSETFKEESKIAAEQANSLQLQALNIDNALLTVGNAVKATKIGDLLMQYQVGIETIRNTSVKLRNAQQITANSEKQVLITAEKGNGLDIKLRGEQMRTTLENAKNNILDADIQGYTQLLPIAQQTWQNKLDQAQSQNTEVLQKFQA